MRGAYSKLYDLISYSLYECCERLLKRLTWTLVNAIKQARLSYRIGRKVDSVSIDRNTSLLLTQVHVYECCVCVSVCVLGPPTGDAVAILIVLSSNVVSVKTLSRLRATIGKLLKICLEWSRLFFNESVMAWLLITFVKH